MCNGHNLKQVSYKFKQLLVYVSESLNLGRCICFFLHGKHSIMSQMGWSNEMTFYVLEGAHALKFGTYLDQDIPSSYLEDTNSGALSGVILPKSKMATSHLVITS